MTEIANQAIGRRSFLKGLALAGVGAAGVASLGGCATPLSDTGNSSAAFDFAQTINWDGQYDVVVVGFGSAGAVTAMSAAEAGASVLLLDKAPLGHEGGNSRYCGQTFMHSNGDEQAARDYFVAMCGSMPVADDVVDTFAKGLATPPEDYAEWYDLNIEDFRTVDQLSPAFAFMSPEYPELPGSDKISMTALHQGNSDGYMWQTQREGVSSRQDKIDVWLESPALHLIQDPQSKTIVGVEVQRKGDNLLIRANNGVVLTCGGFENNPEMVQDYLGLTRCAPLGTLYNTGDGVRMALEVGADLWHMTSYESMMIFGGMGYLVEEGERTTLIPLPAKIYHGSLVLVGNAGNRYLREDELARHGKHYSNGGWKAPKHPSRSFLVFDQTQHDSLVASGRLDEERFAKKLSAPTIAELAELMEADPEQLSQTIADFGKAAQEGYDPAFRRAPETMRAFDDGPFYALEVMPDILNTQGGPRRNGQAEVLDTEGNPIPHLYAAGECGGIASNMYQGGGNMAECMIFGHLAGTNAATVKDPLPPYIAEAVDASPAFTLGVENDLADTGDYEAAAGEYIGKGQGIGGDLIVKVSMDGETIANIEVLEQHETPDIGGKALETLPSIVIEAQSVDVDAISGATTTSNAFFTAVSDALSQA